MADATIAQNDQSRALEMFLTNPSADEVDIVVQNVVAERADEHAVQGGRQLPEGVLHPWDAPRARP